MSQLGMLAIALALMLSPTLVAAKPGTRNLGGGLEQEIAASTKGAKPSASPQAAARIGGKLTHPIVRDAAGRALVRITLDGKLPAATVLQGLKSTAGVEVKASDLKYRKGVIEAYVPAALLADVARRKGVRAVVPSSPSATNVGATTSQGVILHRINRVRDMKGRGITVGALSDSYDTSTRWSIHAADDIASGDLPGPGNPFGNSMPVEVLEDAPDFSDEGRAMLQIVHDIAPKARLGFATAIAGGEVNFANNIRALAGFPDAPNVRPGFKADIIVDDVFFFAEPFFQDGIIAQAVDEVAAAGVSYFSSAGNNRSTEAYDSKVRIVPPSAAASSGLNFSGVPPELYAGGFHDFAEGAGVDISQTVQSSDGSVLVFQWNEAFDPEPPTPVGSPLAEGTGTVPETPPAGPQSFDFFTFNGAAGQLVEIFLDANPAGPTAPNPDLVFFLLDPASNQIAFVDTDTNPESLILELPADGEYTVVVGSFDPFGDFGSPQSGDYTYRVHQVEVVQRVLSDYNLLFFFEGEFIGASAEQNLFSNRPVEIIALFDAPLEIVIARANTPASKNQNVADRIRYIGLFGVFPQEHVSYQTPTTWGHSSARGAMSIAAYPFFAPFMPESYSAQGPSTIYFNENNRRLKSPQVRQKPDMAAMDGGNTTFFVSDTLADADDFPNFFGTSASAPHAAAIGALVLEAAGGPGKVKPNRMRRILQSSAFPHDLDPHFSSGSVEIGRNLLTISASGDQSVPSQLDPDFFTLWNSGPKRLQGFAINGNDANPTGSPRGVVFDRRRNLGLPFTVGRTVGLDPSDVAGRFSQPAIPPGVAGQWQQLNLRFRTGTFGNGDLVTFGADRDEADAIGPAGAVAGNSADLLGGAVMFPSGVIRPGGARFSGFYEDGTPLEGNFMNLIGKGYSPLDGYGFINAEAAVNAVRKPSGRANR